MVSSGGDNNRGEGNLSGAIQRRNKSGRRSLEDPESQTQRPEDDVTHESPTKNAPRRRRRSKTGKRSEPDYTLTGALVRRDRYDRVKHLLSDPEIRDEVVGELDEWGVRHHPKKVAYSDLVEMMLLQWMDRYE